MKNYKNIVVFSFVTACLLAISCKTPQNTTEIKSKPLPESFAISSIDTNTVATKSWKTFYTDPYLIKLIDTALVNNYDVLMSLQKIKAAQSDVLFSKGAMLPNLSAAATAGVSRFGQYTMDGAGNNGTEIYNGTDIPKNLTDYFIGLQTSWELDVFGKLKNQKKAALARVLSSEAMRNVVTTNLIAEIATNYYELLSLDQSIKIIDKNIAIQENALEMVVIMKETAVSNELAVKQFRAQLLNIKAMKFELLQQITETENKINFLIGSYPKPIDRETSFIDANLPKEINFGIPSALLQNRPDIKMAEFDMLASKADVKSAKAAFYPTLSITGSVGYQALKPDLLFNPQSVAYNILGGLTAPLINRSAIRASFNKANASQIDAMYNYQKTILNGYIEVNNEMMRMNNLKGSFELKSDESNTLNQSIDIATDLFKFGRANYLEVLNVQQNALEAELDLIDVKKQQFQSIVNIYKAVGGGWK
ncbi:TolC family protein [Flavobacterium sp. ANB]|uniref:TolC family protein n=1 Tax=unclassified Flavobacterium TaxID=196869 RepID=UPI0012B87F05|nr:MULTISPECIES: TolC family protein [unclassified Flavobacterium]MBF4518973.1 TolC family protein [Flavobacterium sp. ANB]MTD71582.1 efflux transporter outer membrane subunit [Flavobacterium sp. LC2016-13]